MRFPKSLRISIFVFLLLSTGFIPFNTTATSTFATGLTDNEFLRQHQLTNKEISTAKVFISCGFEPVESLTDDFSRDVSSQTTNWQSTEIELMKGEFISIQASGKVQIWANSNKTKFQYSTPNGVAGEQGSSLHVAKGLTDRGLVGKIGSNGEPFGVYSSFSGKASSSGKLYLAINETLNGGAADNKGNWHVNVKVFGQNTGSSSKKGPKITFDGIRRTCKAAENRSTVTLAETLENTGIKLTYEGKVETLTADNFAKAISLAYKETGNGSSAFATNISTIMKIPFINKNRTALISNSELTLGQSILVNYLVTNMADTINNEKVAKLHGSFENKANPSGLPFFIAPAYADESLQMDILKKKLAIATFGAAAGTGLVIVAVLCPVTAPAVLVAMSGLYVSVGAFNASLDLSMAMTHRNVQYFPKEFSGYKNVNEKLKSKMESQAPVWKFEEGIITVDSDDWMTNSGIGRVFVTYGYAVDLQGDPITYNIYYVNSKAGTNPFSANNKKLLRTKQEGRLIIEKMESGEIYYFGVRVSDDKGHEDKNNKIISVKVAGTPKTEPVKQAAPVKPEVEMKKPEIQVQMNEDINYKGPINPVLIKTVNSKDNSYGFTVNNGYAFIAYGGAKRDDKIGGIQVVDIDPPENARIIGEYVLNKVTNNIVVKDAYAIVMCSTGELNILNVSNPSKITNVHTMHFNNRISAIAASGNILFVVTEGEKNGKMRQQYQLIDISQPQSPKVLKSVTSVVSYFSSGRSVINSEYAFIVHNTARILDIIDINPIASSHIVTTYSSPFVYTEDMNGDGVLDNIWEQGFDIAKDGDYLFITMTYIQDSPSTRKAGNAGVSKATWSKDMLILDANPVNPLRLVKRIQFSSNQYCWSVAAKYGHAFVGLHEGGLKIFDVDPPESATLVKSMALPDKISKIEIADRYAYVLCQEAGLQIVKLW